MTETTERKQILIAVNRQFGTHGREIAHFIADHYGIKVLDEKMLKSIAKEKGVDAHELEQFDEHPSHFLFAHKVRGLTNSFADNVAELAFDYIKEKAEEGRSFVIVGHCAEELLKEYKMVSIFVYGDEAARRARVIEQFGLRDVEAQALMDKIDERRKKYHDSHATGEWDSMETYDICVNTDSMRDQKIAEALCTFIDRKLGL